jgi:hypothetical protein
VDPRAGLDDMEKREFLTLLGLELRPLGLPTRNQSLYRLLYPGSTTDMSVVIYRFASTDDKSIILISLLSGELYFTPF